MAITGIDHLALHSADLEGSAEPWRRLGLVPLLGPEEPQRGMMSAVVFLRGDSDSMFSLLFLFVTDPGRALSSERGRALWGGTGSAPISPRVVLESDDLAADQEALSGAGVNCRREEIHDASGELVGTVAVPEVRSDAGPLPWLIEYSLPRAERFLAWRAQGAFDATFDLARLDHLAAIPADMDRTTAAWTSLEGIEPAGELDLSGLTIRQLRVGDAILELLSPEDPSSSLRSRGPGHLLSMVACEVDDLITAVDRARERGFSPGQPAPGVLPGTRRARIPAEELSGVGLQLLERE